MNGPQYQPANGADKTKRNGSHLDQHKRNTKTSVKSSGRGGSVEQLKQNTKSRPSGSHLENRINVPGSDKTTVRGGGDRMGHDRTKGSKRSVRSTQSPKFG